ncbi:MAG: 50S ribosomal protein L6 [Christensenellaceae bacterium]|jgi:large subunit ribosomal protein L6|nr:50S ribosomal protein L6 [Christensenellaceae bacterium]
MSRIGRLPVAIPAGVTVNVSENNLVSVKGPMGQLSQQIHPDMIIQLEGNVLTVSRPSEQKNHKSLHGLSRTLINNMVVGVTSGFTRTLDIVGVGYRAQVQGKNLLINIGYSHPVEMPPADGISFECPSPTRIVVKGIDKQLVGAVAANVRSVRKPEPYLGKGIKYDDEVIRRKEGKTGK